MVLTYPRAQGIIQASWNWPFNRKDTHVYGERGDIHALDSLRSGNFGRRLRAASLPGVGGQAVRGARALNRRRRCAAGPLRRGAACRGPARATLPVP